MSLSSGCGCGGFVDVLCACSVLLCSATSGMDQSSPAQWLAGWMVAGSECERVRVRDRESIVIGVHLSSSILGCACELGFFFFFFLLHFRSRFDWLKKHAMPCHAIGNHTHPLFFSILYIITYHRVGGAWAWSSSLLSCCMDCLALGLGCAGGSAGAVVVGFVCILCYAMPCSCSCI